MALALPPPNRIEIEKRAWKLRLKFWTQDRIAEELGVSQSTISRILGRLEKRALKNLRKRVQRTRARQTLQLEQVADEAFQAWEKSKQPIKRVRQKAVNNVVVEEELTIQDSPGNVAFLAEARAALADVRKAWGIEPKVEAIKSVPIKTIIEVEYVDESNSDSTEETPP